MSIVEMGLTQLFHSKHPAMYWNETFQAAVYPLNRLPTRVLQDDVSPFEKLYKKSPNYKVFRTFGCSCYPFVYDTILIINLRKNLSDVCFLGTVLLKRDISVSMFQVAGYIYQDMLYLMKQVRRMVLY